MNIYTEEEKERAKQVLPQQVKEFIDSDELKRVYAEIHGTLGLNIRQMGAVVEQTTLTLLGLKAQSYFESVIHAELEELPAEKRKQVISAVNEKIFTIAREKLKSR